MTKLFQLALLALTVGLVTPAFAEETHHPPGTAQAQPQPVPGPSQLPAQPTRPGMGMTGQGRMMGGNMMGDAGMPGMMPMMGMMQMMQGGKHIDGRLAFIKAELKITEAQEKVWNDFANALRQAVAKVREANAAMPAMSGMAGNVTPPQLLEQHEKQLAARLDAIRIVKPALGPFYAALSEEQKETLAQLHPMLHGMI
jgi:hypothetical protein